MMGCADFNERMAGLALFISNWSHAPKGRRHGCVLAVDGRYVISTGYNGPPAGTPHCDCDGKPKEYCLANCRAIHAEINAIANAAAIGIATGPNWRGVVAYVTKEPCRFCWGALTNAGIRYIWAPLGPGSNWRPVTEEECDPWPRA